MNKVKQERLIKRAMEIQDLWTFGGFMIGLTIVFAPVHELGHIIVGTLQGQKVIMAGWASVKFDGNVNLWTAIAGYLFEHYVFITIASIGCIKWRKWGWFAYGIALTPLIQWWFSFDRSILGELTLLGDMVCGIMFVIGILVHRSIMFQYNPKLMKVLLHRRYGRIAGWQKDLKI